MLPAPMLPPLSRLRNRRRYKPVACRCARSPAEKASLPSESSSYADIPRIRSDVSGAGRGTGPTCDVGARTDTDGSTGDVAVLDACATPTRCDCGLRSRDPTPAVAAAELDVVVALSQREARLASTATFTASSPNTLAMKSCTACVHTRCHTACAAAASTSKRGRTCDRISGRRNHRRSVWPSLWNTMEWSSGARTRRLARLLNETNGATPRALAHDFAAVATAPAHADVRG